MELHQLRYVVAVARTGTFSRAAAECHVSQPSLSQQIQKLEEELGSRLFDRIKPQVRLTERGAAFVRRATRILEDLESARQEAASDEALLRGTLTVGVLPTIAPYLLPPALAKFRKSFPGVKAIVQEEVTARLLQLLAAGDLDFAILSPPLNDDRMDFETLFEEELLLAVPQDHPLARQRNISSEDLSCEQFILLKEGHCLGDQVLRFCEQHAVAPQINCRSAQMATVQALVAAGLGISLVPEMATRESNSRSPVYRSLKAPRPHRPIAAAWLRTRPPGVIAREFLDGLRQRSRRPADD